MSNEARLFWNRVTEAHKASALDHQRMPELDQAIEDFLAADIERVEILRQALRSGDRATAIYVACRLQLSELRELFEELVVLSSWANAALKSSRELILSLPREWVRARIEATTAPILEHGGHEEYRRILELYSELDRDLTLKLAKKAASSADPDISEAGRDFLDYLGTEFEST